MTTPAPAQLLLASASPRRRELLALMGVPHGVEPSRIDERSVLADHPRTFALRAAYAKAMDVASRAPEGTWVLGADTVVARGMVLYGKPEDAWDALRMLRELSGRPHQVVTGLALARAGTQNTFLRAESTSVYFRDLSPSEIDEYVRGGEPLDKAGAYGIQGLGRELIDRIEGDYYNVVGLPCQALADLLEDAGLPPPASMPATPGRWM